jgi:hypothetical protein
MLLFMMMMMMMMIVMVIIMMLMMMMMIMIMGGRGDDDDAGLIENIAEGEDAGRGTQTSWLLLSRIFISVSATSEVEGPGRSARVFRSVVATLERLLFSAP